MRVAVSMVGFMTNGTITYTTRDGTFPVTSAVFRITNLGNCKLVQYGLYAYEAKEHPEHTEAGLNYGEPGLFSVLPPHQSKIVSVTTPWTIPGEWRPVFQLSEYGWRNKFQELPPWEQDMLLHVLSERWVMHLRYEPVTSGWVPPAPPVSDLKRRLNLL
jgi:hypothetical protein